MRFYRLFLLAALVSLAVACTNPVAPKTPEEKEDPPPPQPKQGLVITPQQMGVWV